jgi:hypothetical protein
MFDSLKEIRGVGDKVYKRLLEHFGSEEAALRTLENLEFQELLPAVPFQKAVELAREAYSRRYSFEYIELFKTPEAREIYTSILAALREHACTDYARLKLALYYPTKDKEELKRRQEEVEKGIALFSKLSGEKLGELKRVLRELRPLVTPRGKRISGSVLATGDEKLYTDLEHYRDLIEVFHLESLEDLEYLRSYELVRLIVTPNTELPPRVEALPRTIFLHSTEEEQIIPEALLSFFLENKETIDACCRGLEILGEPEAGELAGIAEKLSALCDDSGSDRFAYASRNLSSMAEKCLEEANKEVARRVEESGVSLAGKDVLRVLSRLERGDIYASLPQELTSLIASVAKKWEEECARRLGVESEALVFAGLFSGRLYPLEVNSEVLSRLEAFLAEEAAKAEFRRKQEAAAYLKGKEDVVRRALKGLLEADFLLALGEFATRFNATAAEINEDLGFSFTNGKHLLLRKRELAGELSVQPVSYLLGKASSSRVSVLTGANSGGKTTLLELTAQVQIMAQCGLPVLAENARVPLLDEVYFYGRRRGDTSAGAFEALLKSLASIPGNKTKKLILADELEAITEPGAAAKILEALLELFAGMQTCLAVVVTHLGSELRGLSDKVRIDGIEASGLDENLNLIVNRNPVLNKLARSTPELIVERLSKTDREHAGFYRTVLKKFK